MEILMNKTTWPTLYHKGKKDVLYEWSIKVIGDEIHTTHGQVGGKLVVDAPVTALPKNVGKTNETSGHDQAVKEAEAQWQHKLARKYSQTKEETAVPLPLPMLAKEYEKNKKAVLKALEVGPIYMQPKLDGCRCIAKWDGDRIILLSRNGKEWVNVPHINKALEKILTKDEILDGELYIHGVGFQTITSYLKKSRPESALINYFMYDMPHATKTWEERRKSLSQLSDKAVNLMLSCLRRVDSTSIDKVEEIKKTHDLYVTLGFEGAIIRLPEGKYQFGYRSNELLKVKEFDDDEFIVIGHKSGHGSYQNAVCWRCVVSDPNGMGFDVNPEGTLAQKAEWLENADSYIGRKLTVRYFGLTNDGIPRFPIGKGFRDEKDLPTK
jgi:DNA ligase-1